MKNPDFTEVTVKQSVAMVFFLSWILSPLVPSPSLRQKLHVISLLTVLSFKIKTTHYFLVFSFFMLLALGL